MRTIRTEMYFEDVEGADRRRSYLRRDSGEKSNHGLAFAWFRSEVPSPFNIENEKAFDVRAITLEQVRPALDGLLRDIDARDIRFREEFMAGPVQNPAIVDYVYEQTVILEQSPPEGVRFKDILKRTNAPIYVGTFVGVGLSFDQPPLMIVTIPLGIVVVGSALGISEAMAVGLNKTVKRMFDRHKGK